MLSTLLTRRFTCAALLAVAAWGAASTAHARTDVVVSIGVQLPGVHVHAVPVQVPPRYVHVQPRPVFVQPAPVYVHPRPVYIQPHPVYIQPHPVFIQPPMHGHHHGKPRHGWRKAQWERAHLHGHRGHKDHGGRHDRHRI